MSKPLKIPKKGMEKPKVVIKKRKMPTDPYFVTQSDLRDWNPFGKSKDKVE